MPRLDGTGPMGQGAKTGRGMGSCGNGYKINQGRRQFISPKNTLSALENSEKMLLEDLKNIKAQKEALKAQK